MTEPTADLEKMDPDQFGDAMLARVRAAPALLTKAQVHALENQIQGDQYRRAAFAVASLAGADLIDKIGADREFALGVATVYQQLAETKARHRQLVEFIEHLEARLAIAVAVREDMEALFVEARTEPMH